MRTTAGYGQRGTALATLLAAVVLVACQCGGACAARDDGTIFTLVEYNAQTNMRDTWKASIRNVVNDKAVLNSEITLRPGDKVRGRAPFARAHATKNEEMS